VRYGRRVKPRLLLTVIAVAALAIAGVAVIVLTINKPDRPADPDYYVEATSTPGPPGCPDTIIMSFPTDDAMNRAARRVEEDPRFTNVLPETKAENYARFQVTFADQPELVRLAKPESLPATVTFVVGYYHGGRADLLSELRASYAADRVEAPCDEVTSSVSPVPSTTVPTSGR
jgi:hypothetical protein